MIMNYEARHRARGAAQPRARARARERERERDRVGEEERAPSAPPPPFPRGAAFLRAIDWRERRGRAACLGRRGGRGRRVAAPRGGDGTLPLHMRAIGRKGDVSEGSGENGSGVGQRVAEARIVAVRAGVSGCAVGAQWWS